MIQEILKYNREFVASKGYERYITSKYPDVNVPLSAGRYFKAFSRPLSETGSIEDRDHFLFGDSRSEDVWQQLPSLIFGSVG